MQQDTVQPLQALGVPILEKSDRAIQKGLSIDAENRYQTIGDLYKDLYGGPI